MNLPDINFGDVVLVTQIEAFPRKQREETFPAVIVSSNTINENLDTVIVCPIIQAMQISQSKIGATYLPKEVIGLDNNGLVLCVQILTIFRDQITKRIGSLPDCLISSIQVSIKSVLNLED